jgi:hypothetical protein
MNKSVTSPLQCTRSVSPHQPRRTVGADLPGRAAHTAHSNDQAMGNGISKLPWAAPERPLRGTARELQAHSTVNGLMYR